MAAPPSSLLNAEPALRETRVVVVAPTFDNALTLRGVLDDIATLGLPTIVVDDGCTDGTPSLLDDWQVGIPPDAALDRFVIRHASNRGKASALRTGFVRARALGFTHAITIDTDGQHDVDDARRLREQIATMPTALIVGDRPCGAGYPLRSRLGRSASNAIVHFVSGAVVGDSQCGLRVYPLNFILTLDARTDRYAFETEILVRAAWAQLPIRCVPVRCIYDVAAGRVTHFRVLRDSLAAVAMHGRLLTRSLLPWRVRKLVADSDETTGTIFERGCRWLSPIRAWRSLRSSALERDRIGASMGWGLFIGTQPPLGYKGALCLVVARVFRLQPLIVIATSSLSTPPLGFVLWSAAIVIGHILLHGSVPDASQYDVATRGIMPVVRAVALEWVIGGLVFGSALGVTTWLIATAVVRGVSRRPIMMQSSAGGDSRGRDELVGASPSQPSRQRAHQCAE